MQHHSSSDSSTDVNDVECHELEWTHTDQSISSDQTILLESFRLLRVIQIISLSHLLSWQQDRQQHHQMQCSTSSSSISQIKILILTHLDLSPKSLSMSRHFSAMTLISTKRIITYWTDMSVIESLNTHLSASRIMICEFAFKQISCFSSRIISINWTNQSEKFCSIIAILMSTELITTAKERYLQILWKRSISMLNTTSTESRIK
jgi:hypothetical protein